MSVSYAASRTTPIFHAVSIIIWDCRQESISSPNRRESCKKYYEQHGDLNIPLYYTEPDGFQLGLWIRRVSTGKIKLRTNAENGNQIDRLKSIGFVRRKEEPIIPKGLNGTILEGEKFNESK